MLGLITGNAMLAIGHNPELFLSTSHPYSGPC